MLISCFPSSEHGKSIHTSDKLPPLFCWISISPGTSWRFPVWRRLNIFPRSFCVCLHLSVAIRQKNKTASVETRARPFLQYRVAKSSDLINCNTSIRCQEKLLCNLCILHRTVNKFKTFCQTVQIAKFAYYAGPKCMLENIKHRGFCTNLKRASTWDCTYCTYSETSLGDRLVWEVPFSGSDQLIPSAYCYYWKARSRTIA